MLNGIHFLLSYMCNYECDHCFLYCSPDSKGTFTLKQINQVLDEAAKIKTVKWIYWEGGEPFLFYPLMLESMKLAKERGFKNGIVTNSYWATDTNDAQLWLKPMSELAIADFSVSDDTFHYGDTAENLSKYAHLAAKILIIPTGAINIEKPTFEMTMKKEQDKGTPVIGGGAMFRGRAVDTLIEGLPTRKWDRLKECPYEDLIGLGRVHVDCFGNTQICQGLSIGNFWNRSLSELVLEYDPEEHPICGPLIKGGPTQLVKEYNLEHEEEYVDECHLCYLARKSLLDKFPQYLGPQQVYGL
jgi:hypothetical protein